MRKATIDVHDKGQRNLSSIGNKLNPVAEHHCSQLKTGISCTALTWLERESLLIYFYQYSILMSCLLFDTWSWTSSITITWEFVRNAENIAWPKSIELHLRATGVCMHTQVWEASYSNRYFITSEKTIILDKKDNLQVKSQFLSSDFRMTEWTT